MILLWGLACKAKYPQFHTHTLPDSGPLTRGHSASAPAIATRCFCPPLRLEVGRSANSRSPTCCSACCTAACTAAGARLYLQHIGHAPRKQSWFGGSCGLLHYCFTGGRPACLRVVRRGNHPQPQRNQAGRQAGASACSSAHLPRPNATSAATVGITT